uniref:Xylanolytic transcriptional activator regulatory domain-containing protein n=1 Tax=Bionectria ochroleuca TaxID=29856 RepID=A0A8H7N700_BIOOC
MSDDQITHDLIDEAVDLYFAKVFYWIPLIHRSRFKDQIKLAEGRRRLSVVIDAILIATLRFVDRHNHSLSEEDILRLTTEKRKSVLIAAMDNLSIENLQALVILAFTDIGHGTPNRSWSIIGSMTRTAEYLQLTTEESRRNKTSRRRLSPLPATDDWVEQEERRRIFWNIFNLDRCFSVTTGWDAIIDTNKINLKLPANGSYWYAEEPVGCPYFNIGDRPGAEKTDRPSTHVSDQSRSDIPGDAGSPVLSSESSGGSWLGGFAYCIEATEYLRRISTFVLHQDVNFANQKDVRAWLTRFKELDLQLVHWKMFLPRKWSDPNRAPNTSTGPRDLDHNMTLAHVTHNTSMILLHHRIAYPPPDGATASLCPALVAPRHVD